MDKRVERRILVAGIVELVVAQKQEQEIARIVEISNPGVAGDVEIAGPQIREIGLYVSLDDVGVDVYVAPDFLDRRRNPPRIGCGTSRHGRLQPLVGAEARLAHEVLCTLYSFGVGNVLE